MSIQHSKSKFKLLSALKYQRVFRNVVTMACRGTRGIQKWGGATPRVTAWLCCAPTAAVCLLFQFVSLSPCLVVLGLLPLCLPECSAQERNNSWKDFTEVIKFGPLPQSQS